nr:unnamed protein product [Spirometra erinaceieuropaei]
MLRSLARRIFSTRVPETFNVRKHFLGVIPGSPGGEKTKSDAMTSSIEFYLQNVQAYENMLEEERAKYERGRRYLARMMGQDPATFDQSQIDEAVRYFFPSALGSLRARPKLKPPEEIYPEKKKIQFDKTGRPFHDLYYTGKPAFYELMHKATCLYEDLNFKLDRGYIERDFSAFKNPKQLILASSEWLSQEKLSQKLLEPIKDNMYANWLNVMETLVKHPLSWHAEEFIMSYRTSVQADAAKEVFPEPQLDPDLNQKFVDAFGQKKHAFAEVRLFHPGTGKFSVNEKRLLEFFPELGNREQLMFPLQLTGMLGTVDITAKIADTETGSSSKANALRLAISRALACFLPGDLGANRLRAAGLLTQDDRFSERKKPGQKKARKKPIWKAR